jgi:hypothetical protein
MNRKNYPWIMAVASVILVLLACSQTEPGTVNTPTVTNTAPPLVEPVPTATPTPVPVVPPDEPGITPEPPPPGSGEIELRIPDFIGGGEDCVGIFPFTVVENAGVRTITGDGAMYCHFQASGEAGTFHVVLDHTATLAGEIVSGAGSGEGDLLKVIFTFEGSFSAYMTDYPEDVIVPNTEDNPFVINDSGPLALDFDYVDGATVEYSQGNPAPEGSGSSGEIVWTFTLRFAK